MSDDTRRSQNVAIHSSDLTPSSVSRAGSTEPSAGRFMRRLAASAAATTAEILRQALLLIKPNLRRFSLIMLSGLQLSICSKNLRGIGYYDNVTLVTLSRAICNIVNNNVPLRLMKDLTYTE